MPLVEKQRIIFWQNVPSIHQAPLVRSLAERFAGEVVLVAERELSERRQAQGWSRPDFGSARVVVSPSPERRRRVLDERPEDSVHIFGGFHAEPGTYATLKDAIRRKLDVGVFAEPPRSDGIKGHLRRLRYFFHAVRWGRQLKFLLATGDLGVEWYRKCGFPEAMLFPFGYFVEPVNCPARPPERSSSDCRLLFVGQLIECKGVDLLLRALGGLELDSWRLHLVGDGPATRELRRLSLRLGIEQQARWRGVLPNGEVRSLMGECDCLVLPSRYDGWGAVVNEALLAGTPVIVSDAAGACDLIRDDFLGSTFLSESADELRDFLRPRVKAGRLGRLKRKAIRRWSEYHIAPGQGAEYLLSVLQFTFDDIGSRPLAPWRQRDLVAHKQTASNS